MGVTLTDPNGDFSGMGIGWVGDPLPTADLFALFFPGTGYPNGPTVDGAFQGNDLRANSAAVLEAAGLDGGASSFFDTPFTADQLMAINGECTIIVVAKVVAANTPGLFLSFNDTNTKGLGIYASGTGSGSYRGVANPGNGSTYTANIAADAYTGTGYEFLAFTIGSTVGTSKGTLYRKASAAAVIAGTGVSSAAAIDQVSVAGSAIVAAPGGPAAMRIGRASGSSVIGASTEAMVAAYSRAKSANDIAAIYAAAKTFLAARLTPVII